jgi:dolichyl-phosphate-mannose--protein O-mannosyl transferase
VLLAAVYRHNKNFKSTHMSQSRWWQWPFWLGDPTRLAAGHRIWTNNILNNPVAAFLAMAPSGYVAACAPFALVSRCVWNDHYERALIFGVMALCQAMGKLANRWRMRRLS